MVCIAILRCMNGENVFPISRNSRQLNTKPNKANK